ncbi:hypothetical protein AAZX31_09G105500 [Glycine max]
MPLHISLSSSPPLHVSSSLPLPSCFLHPQPPHSFPFFAPNHYTPPLPLPSTTMTPFHFLCPPTTMSPPFSFLFSIHLDATMHYLNNGKGHRPYLGPVTTYISSFGSHLKL